MLPVWRAGSAWRPGRRGPAHHEDSCARRARARVRRRLRQPVRCNAGGRSVQVRNQELAAPDGAVRSVAGAIPGHADDLPFEAVLRHAGGDVRVMVLHPDAARGL